MTTGRTNAQGRTTIRAARDVLDDCRWALMNHTGDLQGEAFRVSWVAVVALLRTVGHVLRNVDAREGDTHLKKAIADLWSNLKAGEKQRQPPIFWDFIEQERNLILKEYILGAKRTAHFPVVDRVGWTVELSGGKSKPGRTGRIEVIGAVTVTSEITRGLFKGKDERVVAEDAVRWWQETLDGIDKAAELGRLGQI